MMLGANKRNAFRRLSCQYLSVFHSADNAALC